MDMSDSLHFKSHAKVNLRLEILNRREDGYHELRTLFQKISLHDTLHFSLKQEKGYFHCGRSSETPPRKEKSGIQSYSIYV